MLFRLNLFTARWSIWASSSGNAAIHFFQELDVVMAEGTIKRLTDKGYGFIDTGTDQDMFFHLSNLDGVAYEELQEGQRVSYTEGQGPKGPRAENVKPIE
jgi:CspA family cold shock protein